MNVLLDRFNFSINLNKVVPRTIDDLITLYLHTFLIVDILNGAILHFLPFTQSLSFGTITRLTVFLLLFIKILNLKGKDAILISLLLLTIGLYLLYFFILNEGGIKEVFYDFSYFIKFLSYFLLILYASKYVTDAKTVESVVNFNLYIYSFVIIFSFVTGIGFETYDSKYYESSKGLFHGNNPTAIVGLTLGYYFCFIKPSNIKFLLLVIAMFFTGSKTFLIIVFFYALKFPKIYFTSLKERRPITLIYSAIVIIGLISIPVLYQKIWMERYYLRAKTVVYNSGNSGLLQTSNLIGLYAFISFDRAYNAQVSLDYFNKEPLRYVAGIGSRLTHYEIFGHKEFLENDFFNLLFMYGVIGCCFYIGFHFFVFMRLPAYMRWLVLLLIAYAFLAGHYMFPPMSNTLGGLLFGVHLIKKREENNTM